MSNQTPPHEPLSFEEPPTTQEYLDRLLPALEAQYAPDRLRELPLVQLQKEIDHVTDDLEILRWRLGLQDHHGGQWDHSRCARLSDSTSLEPPTIEQLYEINWTINRIERNLNAAICAAKADAESGLFSSIKKISVGADRLGEITLKRMASE